MADVISFIFWVNIFQFCYLMHSWEIFWKLKQTNPFYLERYARLKYMLNILFSFRTYTAHTSFFWSNLSFDMLFVTKRFHAFCHEKIFSLTFFKLNMAVLYILVKFIVFFYDYYIFIPRHIIVDVWLVIVNFMLLFFFKTKKSFSSKSSI